MTPQRLRPGRGGARAPGEMPAHVRWLLAMAILGVLAVGLSGVARTPRPGRALPAEDEILAYHVAPDRDLVIKIPIEITAVEVTTWAAVRPVAGADAPARAAACEAARRYPYGFVATFVDERGQEAARQEHDLESRMSCDPERPPGEGEYAARLFGRPDPVTDPRTTLLVTRDVLPRGGLLRLRAKPGPSLAIDPAAPPGTPGEPVAITILSRLEGRYVRGEASRAIFERSLDVDERERITRDVSALGFADLPEPARARVLTGWARRLEAAGAEGTDYDVSRLLLRTFRTPFPRVEGRGAAEFILGERHAAALNFRGPVQLDVEGPPGRTVRVADGWTEPRAVDLGPAGHAAVQLAREDVRTVVIDGVGPDFGVRFAAPRWQASAQIGEIVHAAMPPGAAGAPGWDRVQVPPDVRIVRYLDLDPHMPVIARIAPGQPLLAILIRTEIEMSSGVDRGEAAVVARWGPGPEDRAELQEALPRSRFEWWGEGLDASDPRLAILRVPPGVDHVEITGDPRTRVRLRTAEPDVTETLLRIPYRVELRDDEVWRYAPLDVSMWVDLRAENLDELERSERFSDLREQVRIERPGQGGRGVADLPERTLTPEHAPVRRRLLVPAFQSRGEAYPADAWTPLILPKDLLVAAEGAHAGRLSVVWRAERDRLGKDVVLRVDGEVAKTEPIVALSGLLRAEVPPGAHHVAVEGLGEAGAAYADVPPADGGAIVRRRDVFELTRARTMSLRFPQEPGQTLHLVLFVVTPGGNADFRVRYAIEGAKPASRQRAFFRRVTIPKGVLAARGGDFGKGTLWEAATERRGADGIARVTIRLGDDLAPGDRVVRLALEAHDGEEDLARRLWIGAVLVGQKAPEKEPTQRVWIEEDQ